MMGGAGGRCTGWRAGARGLEALPGQRGRGGRAHRSVQSPVQAARHHAVSVQGDALVLSLERNNEVNMHCGKPYGTRQSNACSGRKLLLSLVALELSCLLLPVWLHWSSVACCCCRSCLRYALNCAQEHIYE